MAKRKTPLETPTDIAEEFAAIREKMMQKAWADSAGLAARLDELLPAILRQLACSPSSGRAR